MTDNHTLPRLHVVGDSISIQYGPYLEPLLEGIAAYSRKTGGPGLLDDQAANGRDSSKVVEYLRSLKQAVHPPIHYLMVNCGLHDIKRPLTGSETLEAHPQHPSTALETLGAQVPIELYIRNLEQIVTLARDMGSTLIWVRTTPVVDAIHNHPGMEFFRYAADVEAYNTVADRIMRRHRVASIDLFTFTRDLGATAYCDHVHYVEGVRAQQAVFIAARLRQIMEKG